MSDNTNLTDLTSDVGKHDKGSVSYESVATDVLTSKKAGHWLLFVSDYATGGTGRWNVTRDPYTGGALQAAYDDQQSNIGREAGHIYLDGSVEEGGVVLGQGAVHIEGAWHDTYNCNAAAHGIDVQSPDVVLENFVIASGGLTSTESSLINQQNEQGELFLHRLEIACNNAREGLRIDGPHQVWADTVHIEGTPASQAVYLSNTDELQFDTIRVTDGDFVLANTIDEATIDNLILLNGALDANAVTGGGPATIDNIYVTGAGDGVFLGSSCRRWDVEGVTATGNAGTGADIRGVDCTVSGVVGNNDGRGVTMTGTRCQFWGISRFNDQSATGSDDLRIGGSAVGCQAFGRFGAVGLGSGATDTGIWGSIDSITGHLPANSTRTLINGVGYNDGDPTTTGTDWTGEGREGIVVYDTTVARPYTEYQYVDGAWQTA